MLDFMVIGFPRSATTWIANWLTTEKTFCGHDPLYVTHYEDLDRLYQYGYHRYCKGVSCTGLWRWPKWVNEHRAKKVILHRDFNAIQDSLDAMGLPLLDYQEKDALHDIEGMHVQFSDLFVEIRARKIWEHLTPEPFNLVRYRSLILQKIEPTDEALKGNPEVQRRLYRELASQTSE